MQFTSESYAVLWSPHQNAFGVETIGDMIATNRRVLAMQEKGDFVVVGITNSREEADDMIRILLDHRDKTAT